MKNKSIRNIGHTPETLRRALKGPGTLRLDGAMGTELLRRGVPTPLPLWSAPANASHPSMVEQIQHDYVAAGSTLITTNTFRTSRYTMEKAGKGDLWQNWNLRAVRIARHATGGRAWVLGSVSTLEDCYRPDLVPDDLTLRRYHRAQIDLLVELGVDGLLLETFNTLRELDVAFRLARRNDMPVIASVVLKDGSHLYDGTELRHLIAWARRTPPDVLCVNCAPPDVLHTAVLRLLYTLDLPLGAYANVGQAGGEMGFEFTHACSAVDYAAWLTRWTRLGLKVVGGCCGTSPDYLRADATSLFASSEL